MKKKKIFILLGHPDHETLNGSLASSYEKGARDAGHEVKRMNIGDMKFDPVFHKGYKRVQELEPDLVTFQESVKWADHFVIFYPSWWSTMPAVLKGLFDRAWLPGFAYRFPQDGYIWERLMKGKTATVVVTADTMPLMQYIIFGDTTNEIRKGILWFSGFSVRVRKFGYLKHFGEWRRKHMLNRVYSWGKRAK